MALQLPGLLSIGQQGTIWGRQTSGSSSNSQEDKPWSRPRKLSTASTSCTYWSQDLQTPGGFVRAASSPIPNCSMHATITDVPIKQTWLLQEEIPPICEAKDASKGVISQLQEFVQGAKLYPMPPNCPVLQWEQETRMLSTSLEFRATVAFLLDGVPHHTVGMWKPSKKVAQRDAADRALGLFVNRWAELAIAERSGPLVGRCCPCPGPNQNHNSQSRQASENAVLLLESFIERRLMRTPTWSHRQEGHLCQAFIELTLFEVPHTFCGKLCKSQKDAYDDAAKRLLWYLQCPGFEDAFQPDPDYVRSIAQEIPEPPVNWAKDGDVEDEDKDKLLAERKTTTMRLQNRLQQAYSRQLEAGTSVWYWSYERDPKEQGWPPVFRAKAHVPLAGRTFTGDWTRGQREAQINTCTQISIFLDETFPKARCALV